jgi:hypothetical protein
VPGVHFDIEAFQCWIAVNATLRSVNEMLSVGWPPHQPFHAFGEVWTPVCDKLVVIVIPSHILESV